MLTVVTARRCQRLGPLPTERMAIRVRIRLPKNLPFSFSPRGSTRRVAARRTCCPENSFAKSNHRNLVAPTLFGTWLSVHIHRPHGRQDAAVGRLRLAVHDGKKRRPGPPRMAAQAQSGHRSLSSLAGSRNGDLDSVVPPAFCVSTEFPLSVSRVNF
jgi:hypothetical protein